jgi:hypothetical protein
LVLPRSPKFDPAAATVPGIFISYPKLRLTKSHSPNRKRRLRRTGASRTFGKIVLYSTGRQMALPPSVHPDSGKLYEWKHSTPEFPLLDVSQWVGNSELNERDSCVKPDNIETASDFEIEPR